MSIFQTIDGEAAPIDQGDAFVDVLLPGTDRRANAVVVNARCDFEHDKADFVKFVVTVPFPLITRRILSGVGFDDQTLDSGQPISKTKYRKAIDALLDNINGNLYPRYHLVPRHSHAFPECYLDFQQVFVIPMGEVQDKLMGSRITRIASPWREQIAARYSGYAVRIGTPDYSPEDLAELLSAAGLVGPADYLDGSE